jgi:hypothetical protein
MVAPSCRMQSLLVIHSLFYFCMCHSFLCLSLQRSCGKLKQNFDEVITKFSLCNIKSKPVGLRRRSTVTRLLRLWDRNSPGAWMSVVILVCCQVEVSGRADHSSREVLLTVVRHCVWSRDLVNEKVLAHWGLRAKNREYISRVTYTYVCAVYKPHFQNVILPLASICVSHENLTSLNKVSCIVFLLALSKSKKERTSTGSSHINSYPPPPPCSTGPTV